MDRETARQEIRARISCKDYLSKSKGGLYDCPFCGSGSGAHGTGALQVYDTNTWYCHACNKYGDVIDLYQQKTGDNYNTALSLLAQKIGLTIDPYSPDAITNPAPVLQNNHIKRFTSDFSEQGNVKTLQLQNCAETPTKAIADYTSYYRECRQRLNDPVAVEYLHKRGISLDTAAMYWIGYDPEADPANAPGAGSNAQKQHPCPRIIIPTSAGHYIARRIDGQHIFEKMNPAGSTPTIFNERALYVQDVQEVFVTEGTFDALSVLEAGAAAIALNSAANAEALIKKLEQRRTEATLILCLDNDDRGVKATETIRAGLQRLNISYVTANISAEYKDPNEHLTSSRATFVEAIKRAQWQTATKPDNTAHYIDNIMRTEIDRFKNDKKTGFANLDAQAGGLYSGLYVIAAISSLGKTSFALQLADQLAERGNDVIFFSLEQSKLELVSKSLARRTAQKNIENAVTSLSIRKGYLPVQVQDAIQEYKKAIEDRISIIEGNFNCNISFIGDYIRQYVQRTGIRPIVFIDYLQILQPADDIWRQNTKEAIDNIVTELKRISRELDLTMIIVSSVNRANYMQPIDFESLKESGSIEFTSDVIWGLQLQCLNNELFTQEKKIKEKRDKIKQAKAETPRKIELCCLKNRYGIANYSCFFEYYPANDLFKEQSTNVAEISAITTHRRTGAIRI